MKHAALPLRIIAVVIIAAIVGFILWEINPSSETLPNNTEPSGFSNVSSKQTSDLSLKQSQELFKQVLWRRPDPKDKILHAAKIELSESKIQWFLKINPSENLLIHLKTNNAFRLEKTSGTPIPQNQPAWFTPANASAKIWTSNNGEMTLIYTPTHLYAQGLMTRFQPGAKNPPTVLSSPALLAPLGRLPQHPPSNPRALKKID
jgi:hypothetical protein